MVVIIEADSARYMKGRITLDKINAAIDELHSLLDAKYKLLATPMSKLGSESLKKYKVQLVVTVSHRIGLQG